MAPVPVVGISMFRSRPYEVTLSRMRYCSASAFSAVTATPALGQSPDIMVIVYHNAFPYLVLMYLERFLNRSIDEEIDTSDLGTVLAAVAAAASMFPAVMDAVVIAEVMTSVMDAMKGCMMPVNAAVESSTNGFTSASESSAPG